MNISDLLGVVVQAGMAPSGNDRLRHSLGGGSGLDSLAGMLGGSSGGDLGGALTSMLGGGSGGGMGGGLLGNILGEAGRAVGGNENLALGGLGALSGALLGGGGKSLGGALGGGVMAWLGTMAFQALTGSGDRTPQVPLGLVAPQTDQDREALEQHADLVLQAMINAAKADGQIDEDEIRRIVGKLEELGVDAEAKRYVLTEMQKPMQTDQLIAAAQGRPELGAQLYGASLLAIEVDTPAEKKYLERLAAGLGLDAGVTQRIHGFVGLQPA